MERHINVCFVSHGAADTNSGVQIEALRSALRAHGVDSIMIDASRASNSRPGFVRPGATWSMSFADRRPADMIHAWTPRENVRRATCIVSAGGRIPHAVHLEDHEEVLLADSVGTQTYAQLKSNPSPRLIASTPEDRIHILRHRSFLGSAIGATMLVDALSCFAPPAIPQITFWPGFEEQFASTPPSAGLRAALGVAPETAMLFYPGNVHPSNQGEVEELYRAVLLMADRGIRVRLVRTGQGEPPASGELERRGLLQHLGIVPRAMVSHLTASATLLVQPGGPGDFNDSRFPSKLPEFLATGRPVILPRANVGLHLRHRWNAWVTQRGDAEEIAVAAATLLGDPALAEAIGRRGRAFALDRLRWPSAARIVADFYLDCLQKRPSSSRTMLSLR